jgi:chromosome segregation ATPase
MGACPYPELESVILWLGEVMPTDMTRVDVVNWNLEDLEDRLSWEESRNCELSHKVEDLEDQIADLEEKVLGLEGRILDLEDEVNTLKRENECLLDMVRA